MSTLDLEPIKARLAAATPGPWDFHVLPQSVGITVATIHSEQGPRETRWTVDLPPEIGGMGTRADAEMIAHAPEDIAALVAEVEQLRAERDGDGDVESGTLWHAQRDVSRLRNELHQIEALRRKAEIRCESLEAQIDAVDGLHRKTPVYDTFADDCEEHDPEEHAIEGLDSSVAGPSTVSSIDW